MGFLPQYYIIKDAILDKNGEYAVSGSNISLRSPIVNLIGQEFTSLPIFTSANCDVWLAQLAVFVSPVAGGTVDESTPFQLIVSSDSDEDKLVIDSADRLVPKSNVNSTKTFENGKCYCNITYTNGGESFDIVCARIAIYNYMIYAQSIDPITIGTGETVTIKIEV